MWAAAGVGRGARLCVLGLRGGRGRDAHHVVETSFFQAEPEGGGVPVAAVGDDLGHLDAPGPRLVDHVEGQLPLLDMAHLGRDGALVTAGHLGRIGLGRGGIPAPGQEQTPVHRCRGAVGSQVKRDSGLAVGDLARGAGVLPGHTRRRVPVLEEPGVINDQRGGFDDRLHAPGQPGPHMRRIPGLEVTKWARACRFPSSPRRAAIGSTDLRPPASNRPRR